MRSEVFTLRIARSNVAHKVSQEIERNRVRESQCKIEVGSYIVWREAITVSQYWELLVESLNSPLSSSLHNA